MARSTPMACMLGLVPKSRFGPAARSLLLLGPLYHMLNSACGAVYAVVLAALAETLLTMLGCTKWRSAFVHPWETA